MSIVPVVDISPFDSGADGKRHVAQQVAAACERVGFLYVAGHGIPSERTTAAWLTFREFFDLPLEEKIALAAPPDIPFGYRPIKGSALAKSMDLPTPPDLREVFVIGTPHVPDDAWYHTPEAAAHFAVNRWPRRPESMPAVLAEYHGLMAALTAKMMRIFAVGLNLPEDFFDPVTDRPSGWLQGNNYPAVTDELMPGQLRLSAHSDYISLSLLVQDEVVSGLEVLGTDSRWHSVPPVPGTLVVNLGDMMARWTNDRWRSTVHRVANPPPHLAARSRQSIAFFAGPNYDAVIECIPTCLAPGERPQYPPIRAGQHLAEKWSKSYGTAATSEKS